MRAFRFSAGRDWSSWPVLLLLLTALAPLGGMMWMMRAALENDRLAVRQRLADAYRVQLESCEREVTRHWQAALTELEKACDPRLTPCEAFKQCLASVNLDSVIVRDSDGRVAYPNRAEPSTQPVADPNWRRAERLEFAERNLAAAADAYRGIADGAQDDRLRAMAEQAQARCLLRAGDTAAAQTVLSRLRLREGVVDLHGRSLAADAELRLLELAERDSAEAKKLAAALRGRLNRYAGSDLTADQRRFLMHRVVELTPEEADFPTLEAEDLAAEFVAANGTPAAGAEFRPTAINGVWSIKTPDARVTALYRTQTIGSQVTSELSDELLPQGVTVVPRSPGEQADADNELMATSLARIMPGWRLAMLTIGAGVFDQAASQRRTVLFTIATALVGLTLALAWFVASGVRRQMQVARLKNDLVATVSHELKTPLASTRLLVDTLLERDGAVDGRTREYLELIAHENARLTRLIDNFLTFSRMERRKHRFSFESVDVRDVVDRAAAAVQDRFDGVEAELKVEADGPLFVRGDIEALVTAVINLLDNAWKYSGERKRVVVRSRAVGDHALIEVEDNGLGLTPRAAKRVFERFYQVDQRLSRAQGGCGLGLSIVKYIVDAHGGAVTVESRVGEGSIFRLTLPAEGSDGRAAAPIDQSRKRPVHSGEEAAR